MYHFGSVLRGVGLGAAALAAVVLFHAPVLAGAMSIAAGSLIMAGTGFCFAATHVAQGGR